MSLGSVVDALACVLGGPARVAAFLAGRSEEGGAARESAAAGPPPVLVSVTSLNKEPSAEWAVNGRACRVRLPMGVRVGGGRRRKIRGFTRDAARRLLFAVNSTDSVVHPRDRWWFVTLTYRVRSVEDRPTPAQAKQHLHRFSQELRRHWATVGGVWKLEPHRSGAPHFHLLLSLPIDVDANAVHWWLARTWNRIAGAEDPKHLAVHLHRDSFQQMRSWEGVSAYSAKYLGKIEANDDPLWSWPGKMWGWVNRSAVTISVEVEELARPVAVVVRRCLGRWYDHQLSGRWRVVDPAGRVSRCWLSLKRAGELRALGFSVRPYHKRCNKRGGIACFLTDGSFKGIIAWAGRQVGDAAGARNRRAMLEPMAVAGGVGESLPRDALPGRGRDRPGGVVAAWPVVQTLPPGRGGPCLQLSDPIW